MADGIWQIAITGMTVENKNQISHFNLIGDINMIFTVNRNIIDNSVILVFQDIETETAEEQAWNMMEMLDAAGFYSCIECFGQYDNAVSFLE